MLLLGVWLSLGTTPCYAQDPSLFTATVPIKNRAEKHRIRAEKEAFERVLVRVSGLSAVASHPIVAEALDNAKSFITRFGFFSRAVPNEVNLQLFMEASFDSDSVLELLRSENLPIWSARRPNVLVWLGVHDADGHRIVGAGDHAVSVETLLDQATVRGVPVLLPLMDVLDFEYIDSADLFNDAQDVLRVASERYDPEGVLIIKMVERSGSVWSASWEFLWDGEEMLEVTDVLELRDGITGGIDWMVDRLVERFAVIANPDAIDEEEVQWIQINRVPNLKVYTDVLSFFEEISTVTDVQLVRIEQESLLLSVRGISSREQLLQLIRLNRNLRELPGNHGLVVRLTWGR